MKTIKLHVPQVCDRSDLQLLETLFRHFADTRYSANWQRRREVLYFGWLNDEQAVWLSSI